MGHWDQIGEENRRHEERLQTLPRRRRVDWLSVVATTAFCAWLALMLYLLLVR